MSVDRRPFSRLFVIVLPLLAACGGTSEPLPEEGPTVEEIPVTTASDKALKAYHDGQAAMDVGRGQQANALFESAVAEDPTFALAYLKIAETAGSTLEFSENLAAAQANLAGKSEGERLLIEIVRTYFENNAERRTTLSQELVERYPNSPRAWLALAGVQSGLNQQRASRESLQRALDLDPGFVAAHFAFWESYLFKEPKDFAQAEQAMQRCLELMPGEAKVHENLGDVYRATNQLERALEAYNQAMLLDATLAAASIKKGHVGSFLGRFDEARADYDVGLAAASDKDRIAFANYRAFVYLHADEPSAALSELDALVRAADEAALPADQAVGAKIFTLTNQMIIALHHGLVDDAGRILEQLTAAMRANAEMAGDDNFSRLQEAGILLWEGYLAGVRGDFAAARDKAEAHRVLLTGDKNPRRFEGYQGLLAMIAALEGDPQAALGHYREADVNDTYFKYHLAVAKEAAGDIEGAKALFREVAEWNFNSVGYALVRRDALSRL